MPTLAFRVSKEVYEVAKKKASESGVSLSEFLREIVLSALNVDSRRPSMNDVLKRIEEIEKRVSEIEKKLNTQKTLVGFSQKLK